MNIVSYVEEGNDGWHLDFVLDDFDEPYFVFDDDDEDFIHKQREAPPPEFDLHLALYILKKESCPDEIFNILEKWIRDNKLAGAKYPRFIKPMPEKIPDFTKAAAT